MGRRGFRALAHRKVGLPGRSAARGTLRNAGIRTALNRDSFVEFRSVSDPYLYAVRLERVLIAAQAIVARSIEPEGISATKARDELLALLDDPELLRAMIDNGATTRHPDAISTQV